jgi:hypothetical protein
LYLLFLLGVRCPNLFCTDVDPAIDLNHPKGSAESALNSRMLSESIAVLPRT